MIWLDLKKWFRRFLPARRFGSDLIEVGRVTWFHWDGEAWVRDVKETDG
jgi:hypothetical protein